MATQPGTEAALDGQASRYFTSLDASIGGLQQRAQQLIDKVNDSRKEDHTMMSSFRESLLLKVGDGERQGACKHRGSSGQGDADDRCQLLAAEQGCTAMRSLLDVFNCVIPPELVAGWGAVRQGATGRERGASSLS